MPDLTFNWIDVFGQSTSLGSGVTNTDTEAFMDVSVTWTAQEALSQAFIFGQDGYVEADESAAGISETSWLKLIGRSNTTTEPTSTTNISFAAADPSLYDDEVENVFFRINDLDTLPGTGDRGTGGLDGFQDSIQIRAFDAVGNLVPVSLTPEGTASVSGDTATGTTGTTLTDPAGSLRVDIAGPVQRIELVYDNGDTGPQYLFVSDIAYTTIDAFPDEDPVAGDDFFSTPTGVPLTDLDIGANDSDPDGPFTTLSGSGTTTLGGTFTVFPDGTADYTPPAGGVTGSDSFTYTVRDPDGNEDTATVTVSVTAGPTDAPFAGDDFFSTPAGVPLAGVDIGVNDSDPDGPFTTVPGTGTTTLGGSFTVFPDGTADYIPPAGGVTGSDSFTYTVRDPDGNEDTATVTVSVTAGPTDAPVAGDDFFTTTPDTPLTDLDIGANDSDPDGPFTTVPGSGTTTLGGTFTVFPDGTADYIPPAGGITGSDSFTYTVRDPDGNEDTATVTVSVTADPNVPPIAVDDTRVAEPFQPIDIDLLANDSDPDGGPVTFIGFTRTLAPGEGTLIDNGDGTAQFIAPAIFDDPISIPYQIEDADGAISTATLTIRPARIDTDVLPVSAGDQPRDPLDGRDEDDDPDDDRDLVSLGGAADTVWTGDDADTIDGGGGDDTIRPGIDDDVVDLGGGDDALVDSQGADTIRGGEGDDFILAGSNTLSNYFDNSTPFIPGATPDLASFGFTRDPNLTDGNDFVQGNTGNDTIFTGDDNDSIEGGLGEDLLDGGIDDDTIRGNRDDDVIFGGHGSDSLDGGEGDDFIDGSLRESEASGYGGYTRADLPDSFIGGAPLGFVEAIDAPDGLPDPTGVFDIDPTNDRDSIFGGLGDDTLIGGDDDDTLIGGSGNDSLDGGIDEDLLIGGRDDDTLLGGQGSDRLEGGSGRDSLDGGSEDDTLLGEEGDDTIFGGSGNDIIDGGAGFDVMDGGDDRDFFVIGTPTDFYGPGGQETVFGGSGGDDVDTLGLDDYGVRGQDWRVVDLRPDSDGNGTDGRVEFLDADGDVTGGFEYVNIEVNCFTPGTLIATPRGERLVETLETGDRVITRDNGIQTISWIGSRTLTGHDLSRRPEFRPVLIRRGALGNDLPEHDLLVSPCHRVLISSEKAALYFDEREVLVAAKHLTDMDGIEEVEPRSVTYLHILFERHEVILSNGAWTESFQPGDYSLRGMADETRDEILALFPELAETEGLQAYGSARRSLKKHEAALLVR